MKGLGMGVHIPVEVEVCTDQARQVPVIFVLLHRAACAFQPLSDCNTPLPAAAASPEETETQRSETHGNLRDLSFPSQSYKHWVFFLVSFSGNKQSSYKASHKEYLLL